MSNGADIASQVDWSRHGSVSTTNYCRCGAVFRSHHKLKTTDSGFVGVTQEPCPGCGSHVNIRRSSSDPELQTIGDRR